MAITASLNTYLSFYTSHSPCTPVYGLARSILALGTLITFVFNPASHLFINLDEAIYTQHVTTSAIVHKLNLFFLFGPSHLGIAKLLSILILILVVSGWRPRITGIFHWWVAFSFSSVSPTIDGGDTIASIISFFLIPLCLADNRKWHWATASNHGTDSFVNLFLWSVLFIIRLQVCIIYLHSGVDKLRIEEWGNGTSTYYWFTNNIYGAADWLKPFIYSLMSQPLIVVSITWGTIVLEIILGMAIFMDRKTLNWRILLMLAIVFHLGIVIIFGLITFFMSMMACLVLYLVPVSRFRRGRELLNIIRFKV